MGDKNNSGGFKSGVTKRALLIGALLCFCIAAGEVYGVAVLHGSAMCADFSTGGAIFLFFVLVLGINVLLKCIGKKAGLSSSELIVVYIMMIIACTIPSWGFVMNLMPLLVGIFYYATPVNRWAEIIHPHIPRWLVPQDKEAIRCFFEGLPKEGNIPWGAWLWPLFNWVVFILVVYFVMICIMVILRKQWIEKERLTFPLTELPSEMVREDGKSIIPPFFRNKLMWIGFAIPAILNTINALHRYWHFISPIQLNWSIPVFDGAASLCTRIYFEVIGLAYLLSLDVSLSLWLFSLLATLQTGFFRRIGFSIEQVAWGEGMASVKYQALGALLVFVAISLWMSRSHLKDVFGKAFCGKKDVDDTNELLSYRVAVFGLILGLLFIVIWLTRVGMSFFPSLFLVMLAFAIFTGLSRIVAQAGLAYGRAALPAPSLAVSGLGSGILGASGIVGLFFTFPWLMDIRTFVMASTANSQKLADRVKLRQRPIFWAILIAILVALMSSMWAVLILCYKEGGINFGGWHFTGMVPREGNIIARWLLHPVSINKGGYLFGGIGAAIMLLLTFMRNSLLWWPIHPIGFAIGPTGPMRWVWFSVFIAWVIKAVILKYGGIGIFRKLRPLFLGLILGGFATAGIWLIIDFFAGMVGNSLTLG